MLATPSEVHPTAIVGEVPRRSIASLALRVGPHAVVRSHTVIYAGSQIGSYLEIGHGVVIREENRSAITSVCVLRSITDATNGFKLFRTEVTKAMNLRQDWLDRYELEPYLLYEAIRLGLKVREVAVTKSHPADRTVGYTKMRAIYDWWRISRPMLLLTLRLRR